MLNVNELPGSTNYKYHIAKGFSDGSLHLAFLLQHQQGIIVGIETSKPGLWAMLKINFRLEKLVG